MSIAQINTLVAQRSSLLEELNKGVKQLNKDFFKNPLDLKTNNVNELINNLKELNCEINQKMQNPDKNAHCWNFISRASVITSILQGTSWTVITGMSIWSIAANASKNKDDECNNLPRDIITLAFSATAIFLTTVLSYTIKTIDDDRGTHGILTEISRVEERSEKRFQKFINDYDELRNNQEKDQNPKKSLKKCVKSYDKIPDGSYRNNLPSRDRWICAMLQLLPDNHPLRVRYEKLKFSAIQLFNSSDEDSSLDDVDSSSQDEKLETKKERSSLEDSEEEKSTTSYSSDTDSSSKSFQGEQLTYVKSEFRPEGSKKEITTKKEFEKEWKAFQKDLGEDIHGIYVGKKEIYKEFQYPIEIVIAP